METAIQWIVLVKLEKTGKEKVRTGYSYLIVDQKKWCH